MKRSFLLALAVAAGCSSGKALKSPTSDTQTDDADDPNRGGIDPTKKLDAGPPRDAGAAADAGPSAISLPNGSPGIGFEDLRFSAALGRFIVPAGRTGNLDLVDPATGTVTAIGGFSVVPAFSGGHADGAVSADDGNGFVFVADQTTKKLHVVDPKSAIVSSVDVASAPGLVRFVAPRGEVWVTEPAESRIEVFSVSAAAVPALQHVAFVALTGAPTGLVIDPARGRAYVAVLPSAVSAIDVGLRTPDNGWATGCASVRGVAHDAAKNIVFVACEEGKVVSLDPAAAGAVIATIDTEKGLDAIAFDANRRQLFAPGATTGAMSIVLVNAFGQLARFGTVKTAVGASSVASDGAGNVYVSDPAHGQLIVIRN